MILGREPAAIAAVVAIAINLAISFGLNLTVEQVAHQHASGSGTGAAGTAGVHPHQLAPPCHRYQGVRPQRWGAGHRDGYLDGYGYAPRGMHNAVHILPRFSTG